MLKIKLFPRGKKHQRTFRIVVAEARSKSNGKVVADLGFYTPSGKFADKQAQKNIQMDKEQLDKWVKNGAQLTLGIDRLLNPDKYPKKIKVKPVKEAKPVEEVKTAEPKVEEKVEEVKPPVEEVKTETVA